MADRKALQGNFLLYKEKRPDLYNQASIPYCAYPFFEKLLPMRSYYPLISWKRRLREQYAQLESLAAHRKKLLNEEIRIGRSFSTKRYAFCFVKKLPTKALIPSHFVFKRNSLASFVSQIYKGHLIYQYCVKMFRSVFMCFFANHIINRKDNKFFF